MLLARIGDGGIGITICICGKTPVPKAYSFTIISGAQSVVVENQPVAMIGSTTITTCSCDPTGTIISGSSTVLSENIPVAWMGSTEIVNRGSGVVINTCTKTNACK